MNRQSELSTLVCKQLAIVIHRSELYVTRSSSAAIRAVQSEINSVLWMMETATTALLDVRDDTVVELCVDAHSQCAYYGRLVARLGDGVSTTTTVRQLDEPAL